MKYDELENGDTFTYINRPGMRQYLKLNDRWTLPVSLTHPSSIYSDPYAEAVKPIDVDVFKVTQ